MLIEQELREVSASLLALKKRFPGAFSPENHAQLTLAIKSVHSILEDFEKERLSRSARSE